MIELTQKNYHRPSAGLYDLDERPVTTDDVPFYVKWAKSPVLELGCGTGRVLIPLAQEGFEVHGLDLSREMLLELEKKLPADSRVQLYHADMCEFDLRRNFPFVIIPLRRTNAVVAHRKRFHNSR